jgi:hypothetical protein
LRASRLNKEFNGIISLQTATEISSSNCLQTFVTKIRIKSPLKENGKGVSHNVIKSTTNGAL